MHDVDRSYDWHAYSQTNRRWTDRNTQCTDECFKALPTYYKTTGNLARYRDGQSQELASIHKATGAGGVRTDRDTDERFQHVGRLGIVAYLARYRDGQSQELASIHKVTGAGGVRTDHDTDERFQHVGQLGIVAYVARYRDG